MIAFGLIPSRRLGSSLGINNIVKRKQCSYNCVYCQVGKTTHKTTIRESNYEPEVLLCEVKNHLYKLDATHQPDYLTFVANGEPTLDLNLGEEITLLKQLTGRFYWPVKTRYCLSLYSNTTDFHPWHSSRFEKQNYRSLGTI